MKLQLGLGVLSLPSTLSILGMIPGVICTCAMAAITTWSAYTVGTFKMRHRSVYAIDDVGAMMFGRFGRIFYGVGFCLCESATYIIVDTKATSLPIIKCIH